MNVILAIDPGPAMSAFVAVADGELRNGAKVPNDELLAQLRAGVHCDLVVIEKVESFGMAVGWEVFETVYWSGMFAEASRPLPVERIGRKAIKVALCGTTKAKDPNIRQALIDRYGGSAAIGKKAAPGPLFGVAGDVWSALAVACAWQDGAR